MGFDFRREEASGLEVNWSKSEFIPLAVPDHLIPVISSILRCNRQHLPTKYLGLPLSIKKPISIAFLPLVQKTQGQIASWKNKLLSYGGRTTLIKSNLGALPIYYMQVFKLPVTVINDLTRVIRAFFWKGEITCSGGHCLVNWAKVTMPKKFGGLGLPDFTRRNNSLLLKWLWKLDREKEGLWATTIRLTQGISDSTLVWNIPPSHSSFFTKDLISLLSMYLVSSAVDPITMTTTWRWTRDGIFTSKSAYSFLQLPGIRCCWQKALWKIKCPPKVKLFAWIALQNKILTADNLAKRGWPATTRCVMCNSLDETSDHLFVRCDFAKWYWNRTLIYLQLPFNSECSQMDLWYANRNLLNLEKRKTWDMLWIAGIWCIWLERNKRIFSNANRPWSALLRWTSSEVESWIKHC
ncbi:hypothetical protein LUZ60_009591 [Juncus effusus]|nr:hypothetical protein LUZ60_009591 [Juncus effusus]